MANYQTSNPYEDIESTTNNLVRQGKQMTPEHLEKILKKNETFFTKLISLCAIAIGSGNWEDWDAIYSFLNESQGIKNSPRIKQKSLQEWLKERE